MGNIWDPARVLLRYLESQGRSAAVALLASASAVCLAPSAIPQTQSSAKQAQFETRLKPYLNRSCIACHNQRVKTAGVAVDGLKPWENIAAESGVWEKVLRKIRTGEMPPPGVPKPPQADSDFVAAWLEKELDEAAAKQPDPGRVAVHRLNRAEYNNAVRDLLGVDFTPADDFPADDSGYGFDNIADVLSLPPVLLEKYLKAAEKVSRSAVGNLRHEPVLDRTTVERRIPQAGRMGEEFPAGTRGGALIRHRFPADAEYLLRVRLRGDMSPNLPPMLEFRIDGRRLQLVEARISEAEEDEEKRRFELRVPVTAGRHDVMVTFLDHAAEGEEPEAPKDAQGRTRRRMLAVDWVEIGGPFNVKGPGDTGSRKIIFTCRPASPHEETACAQSIVARLARRAYRRPVAPHEAAALMRFYRLSREAGDSFEDGVQLAIKAMLVSPNFLFRIERDPAGARPGEVHRISDLELASRLSFFLWSSIPDEPLLSLAEKGKLSDPAALRAQLKRMLADPKSRALTENFAGQWLHLRNLGMVKPDPEKFPEFDDELRQALRRETELFFEAIVKEDRSVLDFLDANFTYANERLARHYGIEGVKGRRFRRVELDGARRGGVLTHGSVLTVSSYPTRTSPVIRGKWILENLLGAPPPPPPPNVPELVEKGLGKTASLRQQMERHRADPACAPCHNKMDSLGFALENYDAVGRWRTHDGDFAIDASGTLPNGARFSDAAELKKILRSNGQEFVQSLAEKLMTYALGRGLERYDKPVVRSITRESAAKDYRFSALVEGIVESVPFRMRRAIGSNPGAKDAAD
jgi:mono/diheme cytochrome c family protein